MSAPSDVTTNHTSGAFHPSPPRSPRRSLYTAPHSCPSLVGCSTSSHTIGTPRDTGLAEASVVQHVCALRRRHTTLVIKVRDSENLYSL
uniref:Uncharacterized protein n=1 Tax=Mesocestoides corti TaxID=53468 RepID=A0A5K3FHM6_MESCO